MAFSFARRLIHWFKKNPRPLPWDGGPRDPYHIWISEVIMQQTRIEQGAAYYLRFVSRFPDVYSLASAAEDEVFRYWEGLGYYNRARNLHAAARQVVADFNGNLPNSFEGLLSLPGIGPSTAAAIASFAFGLPYPVADGNVKRVIARFTGIKLTIDSAVAHEQIRDYASGFMGSADPAMFNQALMNLGAIVCKPTRPLCESCPLSPECYAFQNDLVDILPLRTKKNAVTTRYFHFIVLHNKNKILLQRRASKDIWSGLYAPPLMERSSSRSPTLGQISTFVGDVFHDPQLSHIRSSGIHEQQLSHQTIIGRFHHFDLLSTAKSPADDWIWVTPKNVNTFARPKMIVRFFEELADIPKMFPRKK